MAWLPAPYKKAISLNKSFSEAYNNLANTQKKLGDNKNAISNYMEAIKSDNLNESLGIFLILSPLTIDALICILKKA